MARGIGARGKPDAILMRLKQYNQIFLLAIEIIF